MDQRVNNLRPVNSNNKGNINLIVKNFTNIIHEVANKAIPLFNNKIRKRTVPWWNERCNKAIKEANHAFNVFKRHPSIENKIQHKKLRAIARRTTKESKRKSWMDYVSSINSNTSYSNCWDKIRKIRGTARTISIPALLNHANQIIHHPQDIANELASSFSKNSSDANYDANFLQNIKNYQEIGEEEIFINTEQPFNSIIKLEEIKCVLKRCKNSSPGPDLIPNEFLKQFSDNTLSYLTDLFNFIWINMVFPEKWREAIVVPVSKPNQDMTIASNYRPISLTCTMCKLLEKVINMLRPQ